MMPKHLCSGFMDVSQPMEGHRSPPFRPWLSLVQFSGAQESEQM